MAGRGREGSPGYRPPVKAPARVAARPPQRSAGPSKPVARAPQPRSSGILQRGPSPTPPAPFVGDHALGQIDNTLSKPTPGEFRPSGLGLSKGVQAY